MTDNKYWIFLENLRKSGVTNMYGATPWLMNAFNLSKQEAIEILSDWMRNYDEDDYK